MLNTLFSFQQNTDRDKRLLAGRIGKLLEYVFTDIVF